MNHHTKVVVSVGLGFALVDKTTNYQVVWAARGLGKTDHVAVVYRAPPEGFVSTDGPRKFDPATSWIDVGYYDISPSGQLKSDRVSIFDGSKLSSTKWLNWDGNTVDNPC